VNSLRKNISVRISDLRLPLCIFILLTICSSLFSQSKGGRWQFENNGFDTAEWDAVENNGELQDQAAYSSAAPLQEGIAYLWLDETEEHDFFKIDDSDDLDFNDEDIGISAWIYPVIVGNDVYWILNKGDQYTNPKTTNYSIRISFENKLEFLIRDANNAAQKVASSFTIPANQWTFVAVFYDYTAGKVYIWNDPELDPVDTLDFTQSFFSNVAPLSIGSWYTSNPDVPSIKDFEGRIDDVRIGTTVEQILPVSTEVVNMRETLVPARVHLQQNYPNPFNAQTVIAFELAQNAHVYLSIYDILGRKVKTVVNQNLTSGSYRFIFDAGELSSGDYFYNLQGSGFSPVKRMTILK